MSKRTIKLDADTSPCPKCGNTRKFVAHAQQVCEDGCEVWVVCECGFDPTTEKIGERVEDVWGTLDTANIMTAFSVWDDLVRTTESEGESRG